MALVVSNVRTVERQLANKMQLAVEVIGALAEGYAADACPVDTGLLRNSITHGGAGGFTSKTEYASDDGSVQGKYEDNAIPKDIAGTGQYVVVVGTNVHYAPYVELGTSKMGARPFLRPCIEGHIDEYKEIWKDILEG